MKKHTEARLEDAIIDNLTAEGGFVFVDYREGEAKGRYDKARALDPVAMARARTRRRGLRIDRNWRPHSRTGTRSVGD